jgi:hypothetical protein
VTQPNQSEAIRYVVRPDQQSNDFSRIGVWTPATGYMPETELVIPTAIIEEMTPEGLTVPVGDESATIQMVHFGNTGALDMHWIFFELTEKARATRRGQEQPVMRPEREYCGWNWPVTL